MLNQSEEVIQFMEKLEHPLREEIEKVRAIILDSDEQITEHIKWNAPSFCYNGVDRLTFNLHPQDRIQLVFHRGAKVKDSQDFVFEDSIGLLKWVAADRATLTIQNKQDLEAKKTVLKEVVSQWMKASS